MVQQPAVTTQTVYFGSPYRVALLLTLLVACRESDLIPPPNRPPTADARVLIGDGKSIDEDTDGGMEMLRFELKGKSIELTLDASRSHDADGTIATYRWLSGTAIVADAGVSDDEDGGTTATESVGGRVIPAGEKKGWPSDQAKPKVTLTEGAWAFTLWVIDEDGAISEPDTVQVIVGEGEDPVVAECAAEVLADVAPACATCVCSQGEACRAAVVESACDADCWGLIRCIADMCPDYAEMSAMMPPDYSCVTGQCADYLAGSTAAGAAGDCVVACRDICQE